jgi:L-glyceraldehyde reductase
VFSLLRVSDATSHSADRAGKEKGIKITAYSPLGNNITGKPRVLDSPQVKTIADRLGKTPAQVLIAWGAKSGFFVIPKSVTPERIKVRRLC